MLCNPIATLTQNRAKLIDKADAMVRAALEAGRAIKTEEQSRIDALLAAVERLDQQMERIHQQNRMAAETAVPIN